jgi:hypothetical protein
MPGAINRRGKQYVAALVGSKQSIFVMQGLPELKNTSAAVLRYSFRHCVPFDH